MLKLNLPGNYSGNYLQTIKACFENVTCLRESNMLSYS